MKPARSFFLVALLTTATVAHAFDFRSIGDTPTVMYDTPSNLGIKRFIAPPGMPVEVVHSAHGWAKVRDAAGDMSWVDAKTLSARRTVVVTSANAKVHSQPNDSASLVFSADKGVLLEVAEPITSSWIKVRHRDGQTGYVRGSDVWGK